MKIPAPNYTQTPNVFFDDIAKTLNEGELRVMLVIMRQTFGWHKNWDWITLSQMAEKTGYERRSVVRILKSLSDKGLILKKKIGVSGREKCYYSLVTEEVKVEPRREEEAVETQEEMELFEKSYTSDRTVTPPVTDGSPPPVTVRSPTKETLTKETLTKQQQPPPQPPPLNRVQPVAVSPSRSSFYPFLRDIDILDADKVWLTQHYDEQTVANAVKWALHPETKITKGLAQAIKWACQNKPQAPQLPQDIEAKNKAIAKKYDGAKNEDKTAWIDVCNQYVQVCTTGVNQPDPIFFKENAFQEQFENMLRKYKIPKTKG